MSFLKRQDYLQTSLPVGGDGSRGWGDHGGQQSVRGHLLVLQVRAVQVGVDPCSQVLLELAHCRLLRRDRLGGGRRQRAGSRWGLGAGDFAASVSRSVTAVPPHLRGLHTAVSIGGKGGGREAQGVFCTAFSGRGRGRHFPPFVSTIVFVCSS